MTPRVFTGHSLAETILSRVRTRLQGRPTVTAHVVLDRANAVARAYAERLTRLSEQVGISLIHTDYAQLETVRADPARAPVLCLLPAPDGVDPQAVIGDLGAGRDAEGLHPLHAGLLSLGQPTIRPPTAQAAYLVAAELAGDLSGQVVALVGASPVVGRPLALLLIDAGATVRIAQASTRDLPAETRDADIVIAAAGVPGLIGKRHIRTGAIVIDVGATWTGSALVGDVDVADLAGIARVVTHVPDGVGPVTTACLLENVARLVKGDDP